MAVPAPSSSAPSRAPLKVSVVCTGNICRSPIGEQILRDELLRAGLADQVEVSSAGTAGYHVGEGANVQAVTALERAGLVPQPHVVHQINAAEVAGLDLMLVATRQHRSRLLALGGDEDRVRLLRSFDPEADGADMPDPWSGPDEEFDEVVAFTRAAMPGVIAEIRSRL